MRKFTVREWEDVAMEIDLTQICGCTTDWAAIKKGAKKLGISKTVFRDWLIRWIAYGKKTAEMPIIRSEIDDKRSDSGNVGKVSDLPTLKRSR